MLSICYISSTCKDLIKQLQDCFCPITGKAKMASVVDVKKLQPPDNTNVFREMRSSGTLSSHQSNNFNTMLKTIGECNSIEI